MNAGLYPPLFSYTLSWFASPSVEVSIAVTRIVNTFLLVSLLALITWLLPPRYRLVLLLTMLTVFTTQGLFLLASINPSSWSVVGVGIGWLTLHACLAPGGMSRNHRVALGSACLLAWTMAVGSRWDAAGFVALSASLTVFHALWLHFPQYRRMLPLGTVLLGLLLSVIVQMFTPFSLFRLFGSLFKYADGEPDNLAFFTQNFLNGLPNALAALSEVPTSPGPYLPRLIAPVALIMLGYFVIRTFNRRDPIQVLGFFFVVTAISLTFMAWHALRDERDATELSSRYALPLLVLAIGWWYSLGPADLYGGVSRQLRPAANTATVLFALTVITFAERNVDIQTFGLRFLPEGLDQWWWSWMPVGPNVLVILAPTCLWMFFHSFVRNLPAPRSETVLT